MILKILSIFYRQMHKAVVRMQRERERGRASCSALQLQGRLTDSELRLRRAQDAE